jgi:ATP synthase protein I
VHPQVRWVLNCQLVVTVLAALAAGIAQGAHAAISAALGGGIGFLSGYVYVWRAMRKASAHGATTGPDPKKAFQAQVAGEGYKFALTLLLFAAVFKNYEQLVPLPLFLAYAATIVVYWTALLKQC